MDAWVCGVFQPYDHLREAVKESKEEVRRWLRRVRYCFTLKERMEQEYYVTLYKIVVGTHRIWMDAFGKILPSRGGRRRHSFSRGH